MHYLKYIIAIVLWNMISSSCWLNIWYQLKQWYIILNTSYRRCLLWDRSLALQIEPPCYVLQVNVRVLIWVMDIVWLVARYGGSVWLTLFGRLLFALKIDVKLAERVLRRRCAATWGWFLVTAFSAWFPRRPCSIVWRHITAAGFSRSPAT